MDKDFSPAFWTALERLISEHQVVIDRPKGSCHPKFPYLENTASMDGSGIDVWRGSRFPLDVTGIIVTVDLMKCDSEIKLLLGCTKEEISMVLTFHNDSEYMKGILFHTNVKKAAFWLLFLYCNSLDTK